MFSLHSKGSLARNILLRLSSSAWRRPAAPLRSSLNLASPLSGSSLLLAACAACAPVSSMRSVSQVSVSEYLASRLRDADCDHVFSVAGSYSTEFLDGIGSNQLGPNMAKLTRIGHSNEMEASYAAEGFAKARGGMGAISVSYGAGLLGTVNGITSAFIEHVPVVVINGAPTDKQYRDFTENDVMPYHLIYGDRSGDQRVLQPVTCDQVVLGNAEQIPAQIDSAFQNALSNRQPVYIEVPRDKWTMSVNAPQGKLVTGSNTAWQDDPQNLQAAVDLVWQELSSAKRPLLYAGLELVRYNLVDQFAELVKVSGFRWITDTPTKSILDEFHPQFAGTFCGQLSDQSTLQYVSEKDFLLQLGVWSGVLSTAGMSVDKFLAGSRYVLARHNAVINADRRVLGGVSLKGMLSGLLAKFKTGPQRPPLPSWYHPPTPPPCSQVDNSQQPSFDSFRCVLSQATGLLKQSVICVDATFGFLTCLSLPVHQRQWFNETLYAIIGWSSGASVGVSLGLKAAKKKVLVLVGDGGLMNCPTAISTAAALQLDIIYLVFDNRVYAVDQFFADTEPFKDPKVPFTGAHRLPTWDWVKLAQAWGATGHHAQTNGQLRAILQQLETSKGTHVVQVSIDAHSYPRNVKSLL